MHLEDHTLPCVLYHHGEIDEVVPDSIAIADSYWRIEVPGNGDPADFHNTVHLEDNTLPCVCTTTGEIDEVVLDSIARADSYWRIAYRYLEMVTLQTSTLPSTWRTNTLPSVCYHHGEIDEVVLESIARADSYWRIAYRYLEMVTLVTSTLPSTWRTTRFPVCVPPRGNR